MLFVSVILVGAVGVVYGDLQCPSMCKCFVTPKNGTVCDEKGLSAIPQQLDPFTNLLDFSGNAILILENGTFHKLGLHNIETIRMQRSGIRTVQSRTFANLTKLQTLDLSNNSIEFIHAGTFSELPSLIWLNLANNSITEISYDWFSSGSSLMELNLNNNPIKQLVETPFINLPKLRSLDFGNCKLEKVDSLVFSNLFLLQTLNLRNNCLTTLPKDTLTWMQDLKHIHMDHNPWACDCNIQVVTMVLMLRGFNDCIDNLTCTYQSREVFRWLDVNKTHVQDDCVPHIETHVKHTLMSSGSRFNKSLFFKVMDTTRRLPTRISSHFLESPIVTAGVVLAGFVLCYACFTFACRMSKGRKVRKIYDSYESEDALIQESDKFQDNFYGDDGSTDVSVSIDM